MLTSLLDARSGKKEDVQLMEENAQVLVPTKLARCQVGRLLSIGTVTSFRGDCSGATAAAAVAAAAMIIAISRIMHHEQYQHVLPRCCGGETCSEPAYSPLQDGF